MLIFPDNSLLKSEVSELRCLRACHDIAEACDSESISALCREQKSPTQIVFRW